MLLIDLYSRVEVHDHILPVAFLLVDDCVHQVRVTALRVVSVNLQLSADANFLTSVKEDIVNLPWIVCLLVCKQDCLNVVISLPSSRQHLSNGDCPEDKKEHYRNCSVL